MAETMRETFGDASAEYDKYRYVRIWKGHMVMGDPPENLQEKFEAGIPNAIELMNGLIRRLQEKHAELEQDEETYFATVLPDLNLHPRIDRNQKGSGLHLRYLAAAFIK